MYTCPMHLEVVSDNPGKCFKCSMALILKEDKPALKVIQPEQDLGLSMLTWKSYLPLITIIGVIFIVAITVSVRDTQLGIFSFGKFISYFMTGFFFSFATFKLIDIKGFKEGYSTYDLLAQKVSLYGYIYPFIELFFGLAMILFPVSHSLLIAEIIVMLFSGIGVAIKIARKEPFLCACLGTFLKVPLTNITVIEDFGMALLAFALLFIK